MTLCSYIQHQKHAEGKKINKKGFIKIKNFCASKDMESVKGNLQNGGSYVQIMYHLKDLYLEKTNDPTEIVQRFA